MISGDGVPVGAGGNKSPSLTLRRDELKLSARIGVGERNHGAAGDAVILKEAFGSIGPYSRHA